MYDKCHYLGRTKFLVECWGKCSNIIVNLSWYWIHINSVVVRNPYHIKFNVPFPFCALWQQRDLLVKNNSQKIFFKSFPKRVDNQWCFKRSAALASHATINSWLCFSSRQFLLWKKLLSNIYFMP